MRDMVEESGRRKFELANTRAFDHEGQVIAHLNGLDKNDFVLLVLEPDSARRLMGQIGQALDALYRTGDS
jgi:hypothetical protein